MHVRQNIDHSHRHTQHAFEHYRHVSNTSYTRHLLQFKALCSFNMMSSHDPDSPPPPPSTQMSWITLKLYINTYCWKSSEHHAHMYNSNTWHQHIHIHIEQWQCTLMCGYGCIFRRDLTWSSSLTASTTLSIAVSVTYINWSDFVCMCMLYWCYVNCRDKVCVQALTHSNIEWRPV